MLKPIFLSRRSLLLSLFYFLLLLSPLTGYSREWWQIEVAGIKLDAEVVKSDAEQQMGLGNRFSLPEGQSMLFVYDSPGRKVFWMKRMYFAIDIIWYNELKAVLIEENVPFPQQGTPDYKLERYGKEAIANMVLELPSGYVNKHKLQIGHQLKILKRD